MWSVINASADAIPLSDGSAQCCITSPPYWGLRDYGCDGQIGLEQTPIEYVDRMVQVFREVRRVLRDDGTLWLNLGDSYASGGTGPPSSRSTLRGNGHVGGGTKAAAVGTVRRNRGHMKPSCGRFIGIARRRHCERYGATSKASSSVRWL